MVRDEEHTGNVRALASSNEILPRYRSCGSDHQTEEMNAEPCAQVIRAASCRVVSCRARKKERRHVQRRERERERERRGLVSWRKKIGVAIYIHRGVALEVTRKRVGSHAQFTSNKRARADLPVEERRDVVRIGICTATTSASPPRFTFPRQLLIRGSTHSLQVHLHRYTCNTAPRARLLQQRRGCIVIHRFTRVGVFLSLFLSLAHSRGQKTPVNTG